MAVQHNIIIIIIIIIKMYISHATRKESTSPVVTTALQTQTIASSPNVGQALIFELPVDPSQ